MNVDPIEVRRPLGDKAATAFLYYGASCIDSMRVIEERSIQCVVTSPPYWGLRDYKGDDQVWGGSPDCSHDWDDPDDPHPLESAGTPRTCSGCGAWRGQLGLEPTPQMYVDHLVQVFRAVRSVLRDDGVVWLNLGDSYARGRVGRDDERRMACDPQHWKRTPTGAPSSDRSLPPGLKEKDLVGVPWRVAFALQEDGWYLRSDIVWNKPNPLPESVTDRVTKSHEYIFMLTKGARYFYDADAIREPLTMTPQRRLTPRSGARQAAMREDKKYEYDLRDEPHRQGPEGGRNKRSVWTVTPRPYRGAHFATFPPELVEPCVLAGSSERGRCPLCGSPWRRVVETSGGRDWREDVMEATGMPGELAGDGSYKRGRSRSPLNDTKTRRTTGWAPGCGCPDHEPVPCRVLDPFSGSGTTGLVALDHGRDYVGLDVAADYRDLAVARLLGEEPPSRENEVAPPGGILELLGVQGE